MKYYFSKLYIFSYVKCHNYTQAFKSCHMLILHKNINFNTLPISDDVLFPASSLYFRRHLVGRFIMTSPKNLKSERPKFPITTNSPPKQLTH